MDVYIIDNIYSYILYTSSFVQNWGNIFRDSLFLMIQLRSFGIVHHM